MLRERLRGLIQSQSGSPGLPAAADPRRGSAPDRVLKPEDFAARHSNGLDQFFSYIKGESGLSILDLAGVNQANVSFITNLGHRIYSEDFLRSLQLADNGDALPRVDSFLSHNLNHTDGAFDGVLVWDVLEYLSAPLLAATVENTKTACY